MSQPYNKNRKIRRYENESVRRGKVRRVATDTGYYEGGQWNTLTYSNNGHIIIKETLGQGSFCKVKAAEMLVRGGNY